MSIPHSHWSHLILTPVTQDSKELGEGSRFSFDKLKASPSINHPPPGSETLGPGPFSPDLCQRIRNGPGWASGSCRPPAQHEGPHSNVQTPCVILDKFLLFSGPGDSISVSLSQGHCEVFGGATPSSFTPSHPPWPVSSYLLFGPNWLPSLTRSLGVCSGHLLPHSVPGSLAEDKEL